MEPHDLQVEGLRIGSRSAGAVEDQDHRADLPMFPCIFQLSQYNARRVGVTGFCQVDHADQRPRNEQRDDRT